MADNSYYFSHDYNARSDPKIKKLLARHGVAGYGIYWAIIEDLYNNANALPTDYETIAYDMRTDSKIVESIINDFGLFKNSEDTFMSLSVERRLNQRREKSDKARRSANSRWNSSAEEDANALRTHSDSNAIKGKEKKEYKKKVEGYSQSETAKRFQPPSEDEVKSFISEKGYNVDAGSFIAFYTSKGWMVGSSKMKDWKAAIVTWNKREKNAPLKPATQRYQPSLSVNKKWEDIPAIDYGDSK